MKYRCGLGWVVVSGAKGCGDHIVRTAVSGELGGSSPHFSHKHLSLHPPLLYLYFLYLYFIVFVFADSWASHHHISPTSIYHFVLRFCICIFICIFIVFSFVFAESWEGFRHISPISIYHFIL